MKNFFVLLLAGFLLSTTPAIYFAAERPATQQKKKPDTKKKAGKKTTVKSRKPVTAPKTIQHKQAHTQPVVAKPAESPQPGFIAAPANDDEVVGKTPSGAVVYEGTRGGHYYINSSGQKSYVKEFVGAKIIGKTHDGQTIYEGPHGGRFYYNSAGTKVYVRN
jgi:hypothetical protein